MIDIKKGTTILFLSSGSSISEIQRLITFLSDEYNFILLNTLTDKFRVSPLYKSISCNKGDFIKEIQNNSFRLDGVIINTHHIDTHQIKQIREIYPDLILLIILHIKKLTWLNVYSVSNQVIELVEDENWRKQFYLSSGLLMQLGDRYFFKDYFSEDRIKLEDFKKRYIRDKKLDIFLDDTE